MCTLIHFFMALRLNIVEKSLLVNSEAIFSHPLAALYSSFSSRNPNSSSPSDPDFSAQSVEKDDFDGSESGYNRFRLMGSEESRVLNYFASPNSGDCKNDQRIPNLDEFDENEESGDAEEGCLSELVLHVLIDLLLARYAVISFEICLDNVFVTVVASVQYCALAEKAADAFYKLTNTKAQIQAYVFDVIRASVPKLELDSAFEQKNEIAKAVEQELEKAMSAYGFEIVQTLIVDIEPDERVKRAMNEISAAARMRLAANEKAEAHKILQIKRAEGDAESKYLSRLGIARQRRAIVDGLRESVLAFSVNVPGTTSKDVMDMVLVTQYFDTMKEIGASSKSTSVFIPHGPGAVKDIASQIREGLLQANVTQQN
ncbi:hypothetical protein L1049_009803 [Liquidambar formosana]|uniref:Band 7 domain-containing protein n=1 Tax=Liquidambar formosana TaxID=63359 RepID=A0AAP0N6E5_LIQFO